jgi:hypothetical protein
MLRQQRQNGKSECCGLAGAGLRCADQIFSSENDRKRAELDWGWLGKSHRLRPAHGLRRKSKMIK